MRDLEDGEEIEVQGSSARYTLARKGDVRSCTCPAWRKQAAPIAERTCKHLRAYLGEVAERGRTGTVSATPRLRPRPSWVPRVTEEPVVRDRRRAGLQTALECFPVAYDKMMLVYGLRMPKHLAYAMGFWSGLTDDEKSDAWGFVGTGPCGVGNLFDNGGLERVVMPGLDERLHYRYRADPPEMVSVFGGNSDGSHWGLWYDDPAELPRAICHNWARDSAETSAEGPTLLGTFRDNLYGEHSEPLTDGYPHAGAILDWLEEVHARELEAHREEAIPPLPRRAGTLGGLGPWVPGWLPPADLGTEYERHDRYRANAPIVGDWIDRARRELADGQPGLALVIGRDLHWAELDAYRHDCTQLLIEGYRALGRDAIAEIVRVHHLHRDLPSVDVYAERAVTPLERALGENDADAVAAILREAPESRRLVTHLHVHAPMLDALLPHATPAMIEDAQSFHLGQLHALRLEPDHADAPGDRDAHRKSLLALIEHAGVGARMLEGVIRMNDEATLAATLAKTGPSWRSERGRSVLHHLCRCGHVEGARIALDLGADGNLVDLDGETPYAAVKHAWLDHRQAASQLYDLLRSRGFAPAQPKAPVDAWPAGTKVEHAKFGGGVVKSASGKGDDAKLTITFESGSKTLLAKFVKRAP
ncbi:MAG: ADP-ribosylation family protein [Kofleriaceae bacterium]